MGWELLLQFSRHADVVCFSMLVLRQQKAGENRQDILAVTVRGRRS